MHKKPRLHTRFAKESLGFVQAKFLLPKGSTRTNEL
jgi:hypothetical protein